MKRREQKEDFGEKRNERVVSQLKYQKSGVSVCFLRELTHTSVKSLRKLTHAGNIFKLTLA